MDSNENALMMIILIVINHYYSSVMMMMMMMIIYCLSKCRMTPCFLTAFISSCPKILWFAEFAGVRFLTGDTLRVTALERWISAEIPHDSDLLHLPPYIIMSQDEDMMTF